MRILVSGGLGNQMFIYSFYYAIKGSGRKVELDVSLYNFLKMHNGYELSRIFNVDMPYNSTNRFYYYLLRFILKTGFLVKKDEFEFNKNIFESKYPFLWGYWQSDLYFQKYEDKIKNIFSFKNIDDVNLKLSQEICRKNSVSLHIRRGDFMNYSIYQNVCTVEYYKNAIAEINKRISSPHFYIFSNDLEWSTCFAEELEINYTIVSHNSGENSYLDMFLMSQCHHNIIANSSFSWWGAYLNNNPNKIVIAPKGWDNSDSISYNNVRVPQTWLRL